MPATADPARGTRSTLRMLGMAFEDAQSRGRGAWQRFNGDLDPGRRSLEASQLDGRGIEVDPGRAKELDRAVRTGRWRAARGCVRKPAGEPAGELGGGNGPLAPAGRAAHRPPPAKRSTVARFELRGEPRFVSQTRGYVGRVQGRFVKKRLPWQTFGRRPRELRLKACPGVAIRSATPPGSGPKE